VLYKYGGTYLDTDNICLQRLPKLNNFVGIEYNVTGNIGAGAIRSVSSYITALYIIKPSS
jgi:mannosyltransferase OCH1-like enzyme